MIRCVVVCALLGVMMLSQGCASRSMRDFPLRVVDGETGEALAGAQVEVTNRGWGALSLSRTQSATTDEAGHAVVRVRLPRRGYWTLRVRANEYSNLTVQQHSVEAVGLSREQADGDRRWRVPMFRGPKATLVIVVPDGYRGPLFLDVHRDDAEPSEPDRREFIARPNDAGYVRVDAPLVLWRELQPWFHEGLIEVRYESGQVIPFGRASFHNIAVDIDSFIVRGDDTEPAARAPRDGVMLRPLRHRRDCFMPQHEDSRKIERAYIVGTFKDEAAFYNEMRVMLDRFFEHAGGG